MEEQIQVYRHEGEGLLVSYRNAQWMTGIKNYKPASDVRFMDMLERHLLTDELFAPITEGCVLLSKGMEEQAPIEGIKMEPGCIYSVPMGLWHNVVMPEGGKLVLMERPDTCADNSAFYKLSDSQREQIRELYTANR